MKQNISLLVNVISVIFMIWLGYKYNTLIQKKEYIKTVVEVKTIEKPIIKTQTYKSSDTVIYLTKYDTITKENYKIDSFYVEGKSKLYSDTISLDSSGIVYGIHMVSNDTLYSKYLPIINERHKTITKTIIKQPPLELYFVTGTSGSFGLNLNNINYKKKKFMFEYGYNPFIKKHELKTGIKLFNF